MSLTTEQMECIWARIYLGPSWRRWLWRLVYGHWIVVTVGAWKAVQRALKETDR